MTSKALRFSIIVPVYNVELYLEDCLESLLTQSYCDYEIVIVNDGSTDRSATICERYQRLYPEKIRLIAQRNKGLYEARKSGLRASSGEYIVFVDGDDTLRHDALEVISRQIDGTEADVILYRCCRNIGFREDSYTRFHCLPSKEKMGEALFAVRSSLLTEDRVNGVWLKAARRGCFDTLVAQREEIRLQMREDKLVSAYAVDNARSIDIIDEVLYYYRPNDAGIMKASFDVERCWDLFRVRHDMLVFSEEWDLPCREECDALLLSQLCEQIAKTDHLPRSEKRSHYRALIEKLDDSNVMVEDAKDKLKVHKRILMSLLITQNPLLPAYVSLYSKGMNTLQRMRGR